MKFKAVQLLEKANWKHSNFGTFAAFLRELADKDGIIEVYSLGEKEEVITGQPLTGTNKIEIMFPEVKPSWEEELSDELWAFKTSSETAHKNYSDGLTNVKDLQATYQLAESKVRDLIRKLLSEGK